MVQVSGSQRRIERKQAVILLVLLLGVSLGSFALGVMVGHSGKRDGATQSVDSGQRIPVTRSVPQSAPPAAAPEKAPADNLTFYDTLPKGEQPPLGSGINLAPAPAPEASTKPAPAVTKQAAPAVSSPREVATKPAPAQPAAVRPAAVAAGAYLVQAASFRQAEDANALREGLAKKGYATFTEKADLGEKGVWHRVFIGPFPDSTLAGQAAARLQAEEKLSGMVRRR